MNRADLWLISLDPTVGAEIRKTRPAVVVNDDSVGILPLRVIVPVTEWDDRFATLPWIVRLEPDTTNALRKPSAADAFQIRSVSDRRFVRRLGVVSASDMRLIEGAMALVLRIRSGAALQILGVALSTSLVRRLSINP